MTLFQGGFGEEVGVDGVFDVDHVDAVLAGADDAEAAGARAFEDAGDEVGIAGAPDEVGAEGDGAEGGGVGGEDFAFGDGFGERIRAGAGGRQREGFVGVGEVAAVVDDAGCAGVDEVSHAVAAGAFEEGACAQDVDTEEIVVAAPDADFGGDVKEGVDVFAGGGDGGCVIERGAEEADAAGFEVGRGGAGEHGDAAALGEEAFDEAAAEEAGAAGNEGVSGVHAEDETRRGGGEEADLFSRGRCYRAGAEEGWGFFRRDCDGESGTVRGMKFRMKRRADSTADDQAVGRGEEGGAISGRKKKGRLTTGGRIALGLFFSVFLTFGVVATYSFAVKPWADVWRARSWVAVPCLILSSEVKENRGSDSTTYSVAIAYTYDVDGHTYEGNRYDFTKGSSSGRKGKVAIVKRYREGAEMVCYVNPQNPAESVIERSKVRDWGFGLIPLVFALIGGGGVLFAIFGQRKQAVAGGDFRSQEFRGAWRAGGKADAFDGVAETGSVELKPAGTRVGKLVGMVFFAAFWNGIVSIFVVNVLGDFAGGGVVRWVFLIFLLPFIAIGLFLIGLIVRFTMELANPVPRLTVNRRALAPGETLEVSWRFDGRARRLKSVRLFLEGREEATYRRGTDTRTDKEVFATLEIASAEGFKSGEPGSARLRLPERLMHSFQAENNRVVWVLKIAGGIDWWPDVNEDFAFNVVPGNHRRPEAAELISTS